MSVKPPIPFKELTKTTAKVLKGKVIKGIKKMYAKGFNSDQMLLPLFLDVEYPFSDGENMLMVFGKLSDWKSYIKSQLTAYSARTLKAYAYATFNDKEGYAINIAPVKGKAKQEPRLKKAFKALVGNNIGLNILPDMEENLDLENRVDSAPDDNDEDDETDEMASAEISSTETVEQEKPAKEPVKQNTQPKEEQPAQPAKLDSKSIAALYKETEDLFKQWRNPKLQTATMTVELHQKLAQLQENADQLNPAQTKVFETMKKAANFTVPSPTEEIIEEQAPVVSASQGKPEEEEPQPDFEKAMGDLNSWFANWQAELVKNPQGTAMIIDVCAYIFDNFPEQAAQEPHKAKLKQVADEIQKHQQAAKVYQTNWGELKKEYAEWFEKDNVSAETMAKKLMSFLQLNASSMSAEDTAAANKMLDELNSIIDFKNQKNDKRALYEGGWDFEQLESRLESWRKTAIDGDRIASEVVNQMSYESDIIKDAFALNRDILAFQDKHKDLSAAEMKWIIAASKELSAYINRKEQEDKDLAPYRDIQLRELIKSLKTAAKKLPDALPVDENRKLKQAPSLQMLIAQAENYHNIPCVVANMPTLDAALNAIAAKIDYYANTFISQTNASLMDDKEKAALEQAQQLISQISQQIQSKAKLPDISGVTLELTDKQLNQQQAFSERGTAGEQSASQVALEKRDATVDEMALELARMLQQGKAKDSDSLFGQVIRWVAAGSATLSDLENKYAAVTKHLFGAISVLAADLAMVFGRGLRGAYVLDSLQNKVSPYADLAAATGAMGKTWLSKKLSGEKADINEILENYTAPQLDGLTKGVDMFAKAAFDMLSPEQKQLMGLNHRMLSGRNLLDEAKSEGVGASREALLILKDRNDHYLQMVLAIKDDAEFQRKLDLWADNASEEERKAALDPNSFFAKKLKEKGGTRSAHALRIINQPRFDESERQAIMASDAYSEFDRIIIEQKNKSGITNWLESNETGDSIKAALFGAKSGNPQLGVIAKFAPSELQAFQKPIPADATEEERKQLLAEKKKILQDALAKMRATLKAVKVPESFIADIEETAISNGAKGDAYRKLVKLAEDDNIGLGKDVIAVLEGLDPKGLEFNAIKSKSKTLLETLQNNILNSRNGVEHWQKIVNLLGLTGALAATNLEDAGLQGKSTEDTRAAYKEFRKTNKTRFVTSEETEGLMAKVAQAESDPVYWAQMISSAFEKDKSDKLTIISLLLKAQKSVALDTLKETIRVKFDLKLANFIDSILANGLTPNLGFEQISAENKWYTSNEKSLAKYHKLIDALDAIDLVKYCFNIEEFGAVAKQISEQKQAALAAVEAATGDEKAKAQAALDQLNEDTDTQLTEGMKKLDISAAFTDQLNEVLSEPQAFQIKTKIRDKVVAGLAKMDKARLSEILPGLTAVQIDFLVELVRATSSNEKEDMSNTGVQYHTLSSRGNQKNMATAEHARVLGQVNNAMNTKEFKKLPQAQKELLQAKMNERLRLAGEVKEQKFKNFEETKKKFDDQIKSIVGSVSGALLKTITAPLMGIPFLGGIIEGAVSAVIDSVVDKVLGGDRAGNWGTVFKKMGKDALINIAQKVLGEAAPFLLAASLGEKGFAAVEEFKENVDKVLGKVDATDNKAQGFTKFMQDVRRPLTQMQDFVKDVRIGIKDYQASLEETEGLLGKILAKGIEKGVETASDAAMNALQTQLDRFSHKIRTDIERRGGGFATFVNIVDKLASTTEKAMMLYDAAKSTYDMEQLKQLKDANPNLKGDELLERLRAMKGTEFGDMDERDWKLAKHDIGNYAEAFEMLQEARDEFADALNEDWLQPAKDLLVGTGEVPEQAEEEEQEPAQLSTENPKQSLENLRAALAEQQSKMPPFLAELIKSI